jgi:hypothetical protein
MSEVAAAACLPCWLRDLEYDSGRRFLATEVSLVSFSPVRVSYTHFHFHCTWFN